jgi:transcriptional regulator with GAF, ATPase, and Fis domain
MDKLKALRDKHLAEEEALIREAFEATGWRFREAARWLGLTTASSLQSALRKYPKLKEEAAARAGEGDG